MKPWTFEGVEVARSDAEACGAEAPSGYVCTRMPGHDGEHVAHVFYDKAPGRPSGVVDTWAPEST